MKWRIKLGRMLDPTQGRCFYSAPFHHFVCVGGSGRGKTSLMHRIIDKAEGGIIVIDPTGDLIDKVYDTDWIYVDRNNPISLNPLYRDMSKSKIANELAEVLEIAAQSTADKQVGSTFLMQKIIRNAMRIGVREFDHLSDILYHDWKRAEIDDDYWKHFDDKRGNWYVDKEQIDSAKRISARLSMMVDDDEAGQFLKGKSEFSVKDIAENKKKYIFNFHGFDDFTCCFLGSLITNLMKSYYRNEAKVEGPPLWLFCDEIQYFISDQYIKFFRDCRKYNISINASLHTESQLNSQLIDLINKSVATKVMLEPNFKAVVDIDKQEYDIKLYPPLEPKNKRLPTKEKPTFDFLKDDWIMVK